MGSLNDSVHALTAYVSLSYFFPEAHIPKLIMSNHIRKKWTIYHRRISALHSCVVPLSSISKNDRQQNLSSYYHIIVQKGKRSDTEGCLWDRLSLSILSLALASFKDLVPPLHQVGDIA